VCIIFNPYPANVENMGVPNNANKWQMGFNSVFIGLMYYLVYEDCLMLMFLLVGVL